MAPSVGNWAVGVGVGFAVFDHKSNKVRREIAAHEERAEQAKLDGVIEKLRTDVAKARIQLETAREIAIQTPLELEAARTLEIQTLARYRAGLGTVVEVADAQRLLRQAETDDSLARLGVWRALLALAAAEGDMTGVLAEASR
jgi:outer membrane protein TolC